jgi:hypothetical protein
LWHHRKKASLLAHGALCKSSPEAKQEIGDMGNNIFSGYFEQTYFERIPFWG